MTSCESHWAKKNSMPSGERVLVPLTPNTLIDGATLRQIMQWAQVELYLNLKPQNPFESMLADLVVRTHKAAWDCHEQADWKRHHPDVREINLKYALKGTESSARLFARLESYRAKQIELLLHNSVTAGRKPKVVSGKFARHVEEARQSTRELERQWQAPINETPFPCSAALAVARGPAQACPAGLLQWREREGAACMAERRAPARRRAIKMRSSTGPIRARRSSDGRRCVLYFERPENCSKSLGKALRFCSSPVATH